MNTNTRTSNFTAKLSRLFKRSKRTLLTPEQAEQVEALEAEYQRLYGHCLSVCPDEAEKAYYNEFESYLASPTDEAFQAMKDGQKSKKEILLRYSRLSDVARDALANFCKANAPFLISLLEEGISIIEEQANDLAAKERAAADDVEIPYTESETVTAIRTRARTLQHSIDGLKAVPTSQGSPKMLLKDFLDLNI
jgi:hypothetical protein